MAVSNEINQLALAYVLARQNYLRAVDDARDHGYSADYSGVDDKLLDAFYTAQEAFRTAVQRASERQLREIAGVLIGSADPPL